MKPYILAAGTKWTPTGDYEKLINAYLRLARDYLDLTSCLRENVKYSEWHQINQARMEVRRLEGIYCTGTVAAIGRSHDEVLREVEGSNPSGTQRAPPPPCSDDPSVSTNVGWESRFEKFLEKWLG